MKLTHCSMSYVPLFSRPALSIPLSSETLVSLMDHASWMKIVLKKVYMNEVKSLQDMCIMKCLQQCFESTLRRYLTHAERIIQTILYQ